MFRAIIEARARGVGMAVLALAVLSTQACATEPAAPVATGSSTGSSQVINDAAIKHYIMVDLDETTDVLVLDRWYITHHAPETLTRTGRAQTQYQTSRTYALAPDTAARWRATRGRMTHIGFDSMASFRAGLTPDARARVTMTPPPAELAAGMTVTSVTIAQSPDVALKDDAADTKETPYFRWVLFLNYPDGVDVGSGDAWLEQALAEGLGPRADVRRIFLYRGVRASNPYARVVEVWFDDRRAWRAAVDDAALDVAAPWGGSLSDLDLRSAFIGERPDIDFMTQMRTPP